MTVRSSSFSASSMTASTVFHASSGIYSESVDGKVHAGSNLGAGQPYPGRMR